MKRIFLGSELYKRLFTLEQEEMSSFRLLVNVRGILDELEVHQSLITILKTPKGVSLGSHHC